MTRIILHIGSEKSGSTYLQHWLHRNHAVLLAQGVLYPIDRRLCYRRAHFPLAASLLPPGERDFLRPSHQSAPDALFGQLRRSMRSVDKVILSAEHFSSRFDQAAIRRLHDHLSDFDVQVVLYIRDVAELAISRFGTELRTGRRAWFDPEGISPQDRHYNNWKVIDDWSSVFGRSGVQVRGYATATQRGLAEDFADACDFKPGPDWQQVPRRNENLSLRQAQLLHAANQFLPTWQEAWSRGMPRQYRLASRLRQRLLDNSPSIGPGHEKVAGLLDEDARRALEVRFADVNRRLLECNPAACAFPSPAPPAPQCAPASHPTMETHLELEAALARIGWRKRDGQLQPDRWALPRRAMQGAMRILRGNNIAPNTTD